MNLLRTLAANKHTSGAAVVWVAVSVAAPIAVLWFPGHADQIKQTAEIIEKAAVAYGLFAAGDAGAKT